MPLSTIGYIEKNKLFSSKAWLVLAKIVSPTPTTIRIVSNTEQVTWPVSGGSVFTAFPFILEEITDSRDEVPSVELKASNVARALEGYLETENGLVDSIVTLYVVNSTNVTTPSQGTGTDNQYPELELEFAIIDSHADSQWVYFQLGSSNPWNKRFPRSKVHKNFCRYRYFKGTRCQYSGAETECDRTLYECRITMANSINFGGCPGVAMKGEYV